MNTTASGRGRTVTRALRAAAALAVVLALSGCIKMDMDLTLDEDLVSGSVILAMDKEFLDWAEQMGEGSADEFLGDIGAGEFEELEGATVEPYEDDSYLGQRVSFTDVSLDEFNQGDDSFGIVYDADGGTYTVSGDMDMRDLDMDDPAMEGAEDFMPPGMMDALGQAFDITISITFPGEVREHDGELSGTTVTWRPVPGELNEMNAVASAGGSSTGPVPLIVGVGLAFLAVAVAAFLLIRRNRQQPGGQPADADTAPGSPEPEVDRSPSA